MKNKELIEKILSSYNFNKLNPLQKSSIKLGILEEKNFIISAPTASGKTLCAEFAMFKTLSKNRKTVYIVPLVSLAGEKYQTFKEIYKKFGYKVAISVGDLDSSDPWLSDYDIIVCTTEKLDSLLRHNIQWINEIGLIVVDEIHLLNDISRGPTLEVLLTKLMKMVPKAQVIGLSATISNADEIAKWLNANLVISDFRPVKLYEGVSFDSKIYFDERDSYELKNGKNIENAIVENTLSLNKQILIFTSTRRMTESLAEKLCETTKYCLKKSEHFQLESLSNEIKNILEIPTEQCKKLANCVKNGVAFHHAGLLSEQKRLIEDNFRSGLIKVIVATPTLAMGVNLPAFRVLLRDVKRYYPGKGYIYIPVLEYKQFIGRAGRPAYDTFGESILLANSEDEAKDLIQHFIFGEPENIMSKLASEPALRMHILALISSGFCKTEEDLSNFFNRTFYAFHYGNSSLIEEHLLELLEILIEWKFVIRKNSLMPTKIGKRVSELYLDPLTAHEFVEGLNKVNVKTLNEISVLQLLSNSIEMKPLLSVRNTELSNIENIMLQNHKNFLQNIPEEYDLEYEDFLKSVQLAYIFSQWLNEVTEDRLLKKFRITPGELRGRLEIMDWLIYSFHELALLQGRKDILNFIRKLRVRLKYGIKEELLPLIKLKNIGRIRARKLYNAGLTSLEKLRKIPIESLSQIIGEKIAIEIKKQLDEEKKIIQNSLKFY